MVRFRSFSSLCIVRALRRQAEQPDTVEKETALERQLAERAEEKQREQHMTGGFEEPTLRLLIRPSRYPSTATTGR
jgi:hypothetical protein